MVTHQPAAPRHLVTTPPEIQVHLRCGRPVLVGIAEGLQARCDLTSIDIGQQIQATLQRIPFYLVRVSGLVLIDRDRVGLAGRWAVVPEHRCGVFWVAAATGVPAPTELLDQPPY